MLRFKSVSVTISNPLLWIVLLAFSLVGCDRQTARELEINKTETAVNLTISVAASLTEAMQAIAPLYQQQDRGVSINYNFASSGSLQRQIEQGAPVDVFISAAPKQMDALQSKGLLLDNSRKNLLHNAIVLIVPENSTTISDFEDLTSASVKTLSIGEPESVPAGKYAREVLSALQLYDRLTSKMIFAKNVRQVLAYVESQNVEAGIVYQTDARLSERVKIVAVAPEDSHAPVIYPVAVIKDSQHPEVAKEFIEFLLSDAAGRVFKTYGFALEGL